MPCACLASPRLAGHSCCSPIHSAPRQVHLVLSRADAASPVTQDPGLEATVTLAGDPGLALRLGLVAQLRTPVFAGRPSQLGTLDAAVQPKDGVTTLDSLALTLPDAAVHVRGRLAPGRVAARRGEPGAHGKRLHSGGRAGLHARRQRAPGDADRGDDHRRGSTPGVMRRLHAVDG